MVGFYLKAGVNVTGAHQFEVVVAQIMYVLSLPDDTIDPGDDGTVDIAVLNSGLIPMFGEEMLALEVQATKFRLDKTQLKLDIAKNRISRTENNSKEK